MFKTDLHLFSFILNDIAVPHPIFHGHLRPVRGRRRRRPSALVERGQRNSHPAIARDTVLNVGLSGRYFTHIAHALSELCRYSVASAPRGHWGPAPVLEDCPCPCWTEAIYLCIYAIVFQDGISLTLAHLEKQILAPADRYPLTPAPPDSYPLVGRPGSEKCCPV